MGTSRKESSRETAGTNRLHELWGVLFVALGLLVLISLISHFANPADNVLGAYLGRYLSSGLIVLLGVTSALMFPAAIVYVGAIMFCGKPMPMRGLVYLVLLVLQVSVLLAVHNLPMFSQESFIKGGVLQDNIVGNSVTYLLHFVFGPHCFGPYFLIVLALLLTLAAAFHIHLSEIVKGIRGPTVRAIGFCVSRVRRMRETVRQKAEARAEHSPKARPAPASWPRSQVPRPEAEPAPQRSKAAEGADEAESGQVESTEQVTAEEEAERLLSQELAAFRARRDEPIAISSLEDADEVPAEDESEDHGGSIEDAAGVDPSLIDESVDYFKVPTEEMIRKSKRKPSKPYRLPSPDILADPPAASSIVDRALIEENSRILERTLGNFGVEGRVVHVSPGPVVTRYEIELAPGIKVSRVVNLHDDMSMAMGGRKIRIEAPIPGKPAVGIELPNSEMQMVYFKHILTSEVFRNSKARLPVVIGRGISGVPFVADIERMPHVLIAGQTGSGKSVGINCFLCSLLMTKTPDELRLILIDPKKVEMSYYQGVPHLMAPVVTESGEAVKALKWGVMEMSRRYHLLQKAQARNIESFNMKVDEKTIKEGAIPEEDNKKLPFIVIIVDELADLMMTARRDVEGLVQRIAQLARAVGLHLVVATQRPSVDIITGTIKANLTSRIAFRTIQSNDSRTILGMIGAEKLLGRGDMLFLRSGAPDIERYHGAFISEADVETIVGSIRSQAYETEQIESFEEATADGPSGIGDAAAEGPDGRDENFEEAARLIVGSGLGSTSFIQRRLKLGYARAGRVMDQLEKAGIVGPQQGSKAREVLMTARQLEDMFGQP